LKKRRALRLPIVILTVLFFGIVGVVLFRVLASEKPHSVLLKWNPSVPKPGVTVAGYNIYRSRPDGSFAPLATGVVPPTYVDTKVSQGTTYYYYVTAVDTTGHESLASNNASAVIP
jgi:fibronectin type 3 domain-containing protein